ncbi:pyruvate oxidase [Brucepastera parasyntrophica]|uniref:pyruvate oxidase n=1 Tax=Brucepastera parasyntrophica TaxID=2880008 RepID=UPI00210DD041|nr:pyruvate oxidase [Brucepastera parasyntrophica]ULQ59595.1 pyruvate oxidase [Brucepastera parasyntrophica]
MSGMIKSGLAMMKVLESWGIDHIYGIPGGSINSTMDALYEERQTIRYIQVRHEEVGAIAASADAKLTGKIGVCFGSAGPGATHLFNGLYDAQMDHVPVLALIGQVATTAMNYDSFQELNENPMFTDVSVYNRTVMTAASLPHVVDEAIRRAYEYNGVAVVTIPVDFGFVDIPDKEVSAAGSHRRGLFMPDAKDIAEAVRLIGEAERPVLYAGQGARRARDEIVAFSEYFSMPIVLSVLAKGIIPDDTENFMGMAARLSSKPANEALRAADLIVFAGSDFPFARFFFPENARFIQIDIDSSKLGKRHKTDVAILGDAKESLKQMIATGKKRPSTKFFEACRQNRKNWKTWLHGFDDRDDIPLRAEPVFKEINRVAEKDAIFVTDVGNTTIHAVRLLDMNADGQQFTTSGLFATMGYGVPGGIAAKLSYPGRQVFTLSGDGAFAMVMQDIITQVRYKLPVINIVFSNDSLGFIDAEQEDTKQPKYGVDLTGADYAKAAEAMGAKGYTVTRRDQLPQVFDEARKAGSPVVIDIKIANSRPFPAEAMILDPDTYSKEEIDAFKKRYEVTGMPTLKELLKGA